MGYSADIMKYRASLIHSPRPTKHPGSKPGRVPADWHPGKGNAFRAVTRSVRRQPGWKKRMRSRIEAEQAQERAIQDAQRRKAEALALRATMDQKAKENT